MTLLSCPYSIKSEKLDKIKKYIFERGWMLIGGMIFQGYKAIKIRQFTSTTNEVRLNVAPITRRTLSPWVGKAKLEHIHEKRRHHNRWA